MDFSQYSQYYSDNPSASFGTIVSVVLILAGMWKVFQKAGIPGWHAIIPFLNVYDLCRIGSTKNVILRTVICCLLPILLIVTYIRISKSFGHGGLFGIGMFFLGWIFFPILGFGSSQYLGPRG